LDFLKTYVKDKIPEIEVIEPEATYLIWLDCKKLGMDDKALKNFVIHQANLGLSDGPLFGTGGSGFQRINIACPRKYLETALSRLYSALKSEKII